MTTYEIVDTLDNDVKAVSIMNKNGEHVEGFCITFRKGADLLSVKAWRYFDQFYTYVGETPEACVEAYLKHRG